MKQPRDKNGRFIKMDKTDVGSNGNFSSERSNFNISKVESSSNSLLCCFCLALIITFNICFVVNCNKAIREFKNTVTAENLKFQREIEQIIDTQNKIISNYN